jgi:hypothetical protein
MVSDADNGLRFAQEAFTFGCQLDASAAALQELEPEFALQTANLLAERWLRDKQPLCGSCEVELRSDRDEVT